MNTRSDISDIKQRRMSSPIRFLTRLGGADPRVLENVQSERTRFAHQGIINLSSGLIAALGTWLLSYPVAGEASVGHSPWRPAVDAVLAVVFGVLVVSLNTLLIRSMQGLSGAKAISHALPRLFLAAAIGVVVAGAVVLHVFAVEIAVQAEEDYNARAHEMPSSAANSQIAKELAKVEQEIVDKKAILRDEIGGSSSPNLADAISNYDAAVRAREAAEAATGQAYLAMACERMGAPTSLCEGLATSSEAGDGPIYLARVHEFETAVANLTHKQSAEADARITLAEAQNAADQHYGEAQTQANIDLCGQARNDESKESLPLVVDPECQSGLLHDAETLRIQLDAMTNDRAFAGGEGGLLSRLEALAHIQARSATMMAVTIMLVALFMGIEMLPVLVQTLAVARGTTSYDRAIEQMEADKQERDQSLIEEEEANTAGTDDGIHIPEGMTAESKTTGSSSSEEGR